MISTSKTTDRQAGYSLLEILVVLFIIGLLITLVAPRFMGQVDKGQITAAKAQTRSIKLALDSYRLDMGIYPTAEQGLDALVTPPDGAGANWFGPYLDGETVPLDPWKQPYIYQPPQTDASGRTQPARVISYGADAAPGGEGLNADIQS